MGKTKRNPTIELGVRPPNWTTFKAGLDHYPTPEGIEDFGRDQGTLMMWASDLWAMNAGQPPRFFDKGEDGKWRRKTEPVTIPNTDTLNARQLPGGPALWDAPESIPEQARHQANALEASGNAEAARKLRAMIARGADDDELSVFMALSAGLPDAREKEGTTDNDPFNVIADEPWRLGARGVFKIVRLLRKEYGDGPADLFRKTFHEWAHKPDPVKKPRP